MTSPKKVLIGIAPKLVFFFKTVVIYFVIFIPVSQPSIFAAILKCLPIISLIGFVLMHGMSLGEEYAYSRKILIGLIFSIFGDILLIWPDFFFHGLCSFLLTQICYISAFGFYPFNFWAGAVCYSFMAVGLGVLLPYVDVSLIVGLIVYSIALLTMVWRAIARVQLFEELWTWTKLCSCAGGILFAISDSCIGFHEFYISIPYHQAIIMTTYYAAQFCISLSVVDSKASYLDRQKSLLKRKELHGNGHTSSKVVS